MSNPLSSAHPIERRTRPRVLSAAVGLLAREGLTAGLLNRAADAAGCSVERAQVFFATDEELVLALYDRLASELEARVLELPASGVAERFHAVMRVKMDLAVPYRAAFAALSATLLDPRHELGVFNPRTEIVRHRVRGVFAAVVHDAADRPATDADTLVRALYGTHLALMLLWSQDRLPGSPAVHAALDLFRDLLALAGPLLAGRFDSIFRPLLEAPDEANIEARATTILRLLFRHRRLLPGATACAADPCPSCLALHLPRVKHFLRAGRPVHALLPAFPAKSPSRRKTLGPLPDKAEELALLYLQAVCDEVRAVYAPGLRVTLCSDGHVFSDLVGVADDDVTRYGDEVRALLTRLSLVSLDAFGLSELYEGSDYTEMRRQLVADYARPRAEIEERTRRFDHARALFNGIHRFLFDEQTDVRPGLSRTQLRRECHEHAYEVIRRSDAWGRLLADCFPAALRLSIHPQHPHAEKIGILLGAADDAWLTPWHGVALRVADGWKFVKRHEAEALGARLIERDGQPSHFELS
ncbi:MAG TPA: isocyanide synthase family protein [Gemmataceae bacterium]|nr:isocyanide synthase family protein [Gemmataceae bacterium]